MHFSKRSSKIHNTTVSAAATPAGSRRTSMIGDHDITPRITKVHHNHSASVDLQQIRDEMMQICMSKAIVVHPSQPFVL
ncbi:hypothetical protein EDD11_002205 [Mortierella claussenii]|nr:hypothetical protein EDD11_002205 [Mortierella claussenii]